MKNEFVVNENGLEVRYEIVKLSKYKGNNYIIYKDNDNYYASRYDIIDNKIQLDEIIGDDEWDFIDKELMILDELR